MADGAHLVEQQQIKVKSHKNPHEKQCFIVKIALFIRVNPLATLVGGNPLATNFADTMITLFTMITLTFLSLLIFHHFNCLIFE